MGKEAANKDLRGGVHKFTYKSSNLGDAAAYPLSKSNVRTLSHRITHLIASITKQCL